MKKSMLLVLCALLTCSIALYGCQPAGAVEGNDDPTTAPTTQEPTTEEPTTEAPSTEEPATEPTTEGVTPATDLTGTPAEIYAGIVAQSDAEIGMTFDETVTGENSKSYLGLTADEMTEHVDEAFVSNAAINVNAHLVAVIKCKDEAAATQVKALVAAGFDSGRWVCVRPEQSVVVEAGQYVLLISSKNDTADALLKGFEALAGDAMGEADAFYTGENN